MVLLEKQQNHTDDKSSSYDFNNESVCYEIPIEYVGDEIVENDADVDVDEPIDFGEGERENLKLKREKPTYPPALYRSLRKTPPEPESFSPPSPQPQTPTEKLMQRDKSSIIYDTVSRKRYHTSPHDKHRVGKITSLSNQSLFKNTNTKSKNHFLNSQSLHSYQLIHFFFSFSKRLRL